MSSQATPQPSTVVWPMDGPPVAPSITYVSTEAVIPIPPQVVTPPPTGQPTLVPQTPQDQAALLAKISAPVPLQ